MADDLPRYKNWLPHGDPENDIFQALPSGYTTGVVPPYADRPTLVAGKLGLQSVVERTGDVEGYDPDDRALRLPGYVNATNADQPQTGNIWGFVHPPTEAQVASLPISHPDYYKAWPRYSNRHTEYKLVVGTQQFSPNGNYVRPGRYKLYQYRGTGIIRTSGYSAGVQPVNPTTQIWPDPWIENPTFTWTHDSPGYYRSPDEEFEVVGPNISVTVSPGAQTVPEGTDATITVTVSPVGPFDGDIFSDGIYFRPVNDPSGTALLPAIRTGHTDSPGGRVITWRVRTTGWQGSFTVTGWASAFYVLREGTATLTIGTPSNNPAPPPSPPPSTSAEDGNLISFTISPSRRRWRAYAKDGKLRVGYATSEDGGPGAAPAPLPWSDTNTNIAGASPCIRVENDNDSTLFLAYKVGSSGVAMRTSTDEAKTWSDPVTVFTAGTRPILVMCEDRRKVCFAINGKALMCKVLSADNSTQIDTFTAIGAGVDEASAWENITDGGDWQIEVLVRSGAAMKLYKGVPASATSMTFSEITT